MVYCHLKTVLSHKQQGITLIEVMVAVAILAFSLSALVKLGGESANTLHYLEKKSYAEWVALNQINEMTVLLQWPDVGRSQGQDKMAAQTWSRERVVSNTGVPELRRLDLKVKEFKGDEEAIFSITSFIRQPLP